VTVEIAEPLGDEVIVHARAGEDMVVFKQDPHRQPAIGDEMEVQVELDGLYLFDAETQRRLG
jgi:multiple sugar transport system ATP-binding protein